MLSIFRIVSLLFTIISLAVLTTPDRSSAQAAFSIATTDTTISTIAGGGFGSDVPVRQAPMVLPTAVALDPRGRGFYVIDEVDGTSLLRFVNTTANSLALAGVTISPNSINLIAGGGIQSNDGLSPLDTDLAQVTGIAVDPSGNAIYLTIPSFSAIRVINVGTQDFNVLGKTIVPGKAVDGMNLLWFSDLVVSGGGTMNREAAALGVPVYSIFRGKTGAVDLKLEQENRLIMVRSVEEVKTKIQFQRRDKNKLPESRPRQALSDIVDHVEAIIRQEYPNKR